MVECPASQRRLSVSTSARSFWAPLAIVVFVLAAIGFMVLPTAVAAGRARIGLFGILLLVAIGSSVMVGLFVRARSTIVPAEPLRGAEGALVVWEPPAGYRE